MEEIINNKTENSNQKNENNKPTKIVLSNQNNLYLTGVSKVLTSTESEISVILNNQNFSVFGQKLSVTKLDVESGVLEANGLVTNMKFAGHKQKENFFKRIFG